MARNVAEAKRVFRIGVMMCPLLDVSVAAIWLNYSNHIPNLYPNIVKHSDDSIKIIIIGIFVLEMLSNVCLGTIIGLGNPNGISTYPSLITAYMVSLPLTYISTFYLGYGELGLFMGLGF